MILLSFLATSAEDASPVPELPPEIYSKIINFCSSGDALAGQAKYEQAIAEYDRAWLLLPEPRNEWEAATWILSAIGDAHFLGESYDLAKEVLSQVMFCPSALGNPFLHLRLGESLFELGNLDRAADELMRAYMGGGDELFQDQNPKYLAFLWTRAKRPSDGLTT